MSGAATLFRTRFAFVCDRCDLGYKAGRLAAFDLDRRLICATCAVGADPDNDTAAPASGEESSPCPPPPASPTLFD